MSNDIDENHTDVKMRIFNVHILIISKCQKQKV